jgi:hypothetical protein
MNNVSNEFNYDFNDLSRTYNLYDPFDVINEINTLKKSKENEFDNLSTEVKTLRAYQLQLLLIEADSFIKYYHDEYMIQPADYRSDEISKWVNNHLDEIQGTSYLMKRGILLVKKFKELKF